MRNQKLLSVSFIKGSLLALCVTAMCATQAHADYTEGLVARWSFNKGNASDLISDVGNYTLTPSGVGANQTLTYNNDGTISLGSGMGLFATGINSTDLPALQNGVTIWVSYTYTDFSGTSGRGLFGLVNATAPITGASSDEFTSNLTAVFQRVNTANRTGRFYGRLEGGTQITPGGSEFLQIPESGAIASAIVFDGGVNYFNYINGAKGGERSLTDTQTTLNVFQSFGIGRLVQSGGSEGTITIDEIRIYEGALSVEQLNQISPIPEKSTTASLVAVTTLSFMVFLRMKKKHRA